MSRALSKYRVSSAIAAAALTVTGSVARADTDTFTGATSASNTNAVGNGSYNYGAPYGYAGPITTYTIDAAGTNLSGAFTGGVDELLFDGSATGSIFNLAVDGTITSSGNPTAVRFNDAGGAGKTYIFHKASTTSAGNSLGIAGGTATGADTDSYSSGALFGATPAPAGTSLVLDSGFTGKVVLRARADSLATGTTTINGGTLEINDAGALPTNGVNSNNPGQVTLNGGTLAVNVNTGNEETQEGSRNASSGQLNGTLLVTANSTLANTAINFDGSARRQDIWGAQAGGPITLSNNVTLNVQAGGGATIRNAITVASGSASIDLGNSSNYLRLAAAAAGNQSVAYNIGTSSASLDLGGTGVYNLGHVSGASTTALRGGTGGVVTAQIGNLGQSTNYGGQILNGFGSSTGGAAPPAGTVRHLNVAKVGTGTLTLSGENRYSGTTAVSGGTLQAGSTSAFGDSASNITVSTGGTLDLNGNSQEAGKSFVLAGGSLVNNGASPVSIHTGASAHVNDNASGTVFGSGTATGSPSDASWSINGGTTPTVAISGGGGSGATADAKMQLGWLRINPTTLGNRGTGYTTAPKLIFSAPDDPNGRPIQAYAIIGPPGAANAGQVATVQVVDPGWGYTSVPTLTIVNTGTGGSGFAPVFAMQVNELEMTNAGSGYTTGPMSVTIGNLGTPFNTGSASLTPATPLATGGFGKIDITATSNIGGSGNLVVDAVASGAGGLNKIGGGTVLLNATNTYLGLTDVQAGTLGGTGSIAGNLQVASGATLAPGESIDTFGVGGDANIDGTFAIEYDGAGAGDIDLLTVTGLLDITGATASFSQFGAAADDAAYVFATYGTFSGPFAGISGLPAGYTIDYDYFDGNDSNNIALVPVPEPGAIGAIALAGLGVLGRRRGRRMA